MSWYEETYEDVCNNLQSIFDLSYEGRRTSYASELPILPDQPKRERDLEYKRKVLGLVIESRNALKMAEEEYLASGDYARNMMMINRLRLYIGWCMCVLVANY
tara:strand:+ start:179 stop:487 length:309 start_codon:yes stop_codon:yes gene_type:complete